MGTLYVVATPIGNLNDMTKRAVDTLKKVKYIAAEDTRHLLPLLKHFEIKGPKLFSLHKFNEAKKMEMILDKLINEDNDVALVSDAGTPCISDPGGALVKAARDRNVTVIGIPGASALTSAVSISGLDVDQFTFLGFFPRENKQKNSFVKTIKQSEIKTCVIYESPLRIKNTLQFLSDNFPDAIGYLGNDLTKMFEVSYYGNLNEILSKLNENENAEKGEYVLVIEPRAAAEKQGNELSIEALLIDEMISNNITVKEAVIKLAEKKQYSKNDIYKASLKIKDLFKSM